MARNVGRSDSSCSRCGSGWWQGLHGGSRLCSRPGVNQADSLAMAPLYAKAGTDDLKVTRISALRATATICGRGRYAKNKSSICSMKSVSVKHVPKTFSSTCATYCAKSP